MRRRTSSGSRGNVEAGHPRLALGGDRQCREHADRRGLAGAVVAEQTEHRAGLDVEIEVTQRPEIAELLAETDRPDPGMDRARRRRRDDIRMPYFFFVHSTNSLSSTLYEWQAVIPDSRHTPITVRCTRDPTQQRRRRRPAKSNRLPIDSVPKSTRRRPSSPARPRCSRTSPRASPRTTCWTRPEPGARRTKFTRDEIAAAAVKIADEEGFDALSMRRLALELDAGTMTLYHYVRTKDELLAIVNDSVMGELIVPDGELPTDWRDAISVIAHRSREVLRRHPWTLDIRDDPAPGPNGVRHFDQSMQAVMSLGITLAERFDLITAVDEYVFGFCMNERNNFMDGDTSLGADVKDYMAGLVASGDYPALAAIEAEYGIDGAFAELARQALDPERFTRNLNRLLDGFALEVDRD